MLRNKKSKPRSIQSVMHYRFSNDIINLNKMKIIYQELHSELNAILYLLCKE